jgi:hypothetical protein
MTQFCAREMERGASTSSARAAGGGQRPSSNTGAFFGFIKRSIKHSDDFIYHK